MIRFQIGREKYLSILLRTITLLWKNGIMIRTMGAADKMLYLSELSKFINAYKSASSRLIKKEYPEVRQKLWKETFWSQSFCLLSAGGAPIEVIRQYIETQGEGKSEHRVPFSDLSE